MSWDTRQEVQAFQERGWHKQRQGGDMRHVQAMARRLTWKHWMAHMEKPWETPQERDEGRAENTRPQRVTPILRQYGTPSGPELF